MSAPANRRLFVLLSLLFLSTPAVPETPSGAAAGPLAVETAWFRLYSDPWVNLHHTLYFQAATEEAAAEPGRRPRRLGTGPDDLGALDRLADAERTAWRRAVDLYRAELADRDLLFGAQMIPLRNSLSRGGASEVQRAIEAGELADLPVALPDALDAAMAVYAAHLWPAHDRRNRAWIGDTVPRLERIGPAVAPKLARAFGGAWPAGGLRADVTVYAGWAGAYSSHGPDQIAISSTDPGHAGDAAVESLFHEAGHSEAVGAELGTLADRAFEAAGRPTPDRFWHGLLFYTAGELTRQAVENGGTPGYRPYALLQGLVDRSPDWPDWWRALDAHWRPYLAAEDGTGPSRDEALAAVAARLGGAPKP